VYFVSTSAGLNIVSGTANCISSAVCVPSITKVRISSYLEKNSSGSWVTLKHWSKEAYSNSTSLGKTYSVSSGSYRNYCYIYAYIDDVCVESTTRVAYDSY
jgi:hypothetical protein